MGQMFDACPTEGGVGGDDRLDFVTEQLLRHHLHVG